jgi:hypothetical protein
MSPSLSRPYVRASVRPNVRMYVRRVRQNVAGPSATSASASSQASLVPTMRTGQLRHCSRLETVNGARHGWMTSERARGRNDESPCEANVWSAPAASRMDMRSKARSRRRSREQVRTNRNSAPISALRAVSVGGGQHAGLLNESQRSMPSLERIRIVLRVDDGSRIKEAQRVLRIIIVDNDNLDHMAEWHSIAPARCKRNRRRSAAFSAHFGIRRRFSRTGPSPARQWPQALVPETARVCSNARRT